MTKLHKIIKLEKKIERARRSLNKLKDFDPLLLFSFFDKYEKYPNKYYGDVEEDPNDEFKSKQYLDIRKLKTSFKKLGISMTSSRLKKFFRRYNVSDNGKITLHEFLDIFIPKEMDPKYFKPASETLVQRVKVLTQIEHFVTVDTLFQIRDFLFLHIRTDKAIEKVLQEVQIIPSLEIVADLKLAKVKLDEIITTQGLKRIFLTHNIAINEVDASLLLDRFNSTITCKITYIDLAGNRGKLLKYLYFRTLFQTDTFKNTQ